MHQFFLHNYAFFMLNDFFGKLLVTYKKENRANIEENKNKL